MKTSLLSVILLLGAILPARSQELPVMAEEVPTATMTLKKGQIPPAIRTATEGIFKEQATINFGSLPDELKGYNWTETDGSSNDIQTDQYKILFRTKDGDHGYAMVTKDGQLISYRVVENNAGIPAGILNSISEAGYRNWGIVSESARVTDKNSNVKALYSVTLKKGDQKKTLEYDANGKMVSERG